MSDEDDLDDEAEWDESASFVDCTCEHDPGEHGWGRCDVDGCLCEGGWQE